MGFFVTCVKRMDKANMIIGLQILNPVVCLSLALSPPINQLITKIITIRIILLTVRTASRLIQSSQVVWLLDFIIALILTTIFFVKLSAIVYPTLVA